MITTIILGMLCVYLLCFSVMFLLISSRLADKKMGMDVFALGNLLLGSAYILQLVGGAPGWSMLSVINHTLTLCAPATYVLGAMRFFERQTPILRPLIILAAAYTAAQIFTHLWLGNEARHALLAGACAALFLTMAVAAFHSSRSFAKDLRMEMLVITFLIAGICVLNAAKFVMILRGGMDTLNMHGDFQKAFYLYMSFLATVLPPCVVWLVLRRLTDQLRRLAAHDPMTRVLNRRGLTDALDAYFLSRSAKPAYLLMVDIDHFKRINDTCGHKAGDLVLCRVAHVLKDTARQGDLIARLGGEEFVVVAFSPDREGALQLAERIREAIEELEVPDPKRDLAIRCTATIGVSSAFASAQSVDECLQQADVALYQGKRAGRNRVSASLPAISSAP